MNRLPNFANDIEILAILTYNVGNETYWREALMYNLLIGGAAGQGVDTTAAILEKSFKGY